LAQALTVAAAGEDIYLATPSSAGSYIGNWVVSTAGTSSGSPLTIEPAPGVSDAILDGNDGSSVGCTTSACDEQVLTVETGVYLNLDDLTVQDADDTTYPNGVSAPTGGAIYSRGFLSVSASSFVDNIDAGGGPAVGEGDGGAVAAVAGSLTVTSSLFTGNTAGTNGLAGAIETLVPTSITASTFSANGANSGGAITVGGADLTVGTTTFSSNNAVVGGAILVGTGASLASSATISASTFSGNTASDKGGAISSGTFNQASDSVVVSTSTFSANSAATEGGAIDNGFASTTPDPFVVSGSTFSGNTAPLGPDIDNSDLGGGGALWLAADVLADGCESTLLQLHDGGYNVSTNGACDGGGVTTDAVDASLSSQLAPLANNGGLTETIWPNAGGAAVALIPSPTSVTLNANLVTLCPTTDQRGVSTAMGQACNAGSVQFAPPAPTAPAAPPTTAPAPPLPMFPGAASSYPDGAIVDFGGTFYVFAGGHAFGIPNPAALEGVQAADPAAVVPAVTTSPPSAPARPGTLVVVHNSPEIYVVGTDGMLHGFATPGQLTGNGYDGALVITVPNLGGMAVAAPVGQLGSAANAASTAADGSIVNQDGTFYVLAGGHAFGIATPADLSALLATEPGATTPIGGSLSATATGTTIADGCWSRATTGSGSARVASCSPSGRWAS
jgi:predicted outer membrane repeat protein